MFVKWKHEMKLVFGHAISSYDVTIQMDMGDTHPILRWKTSNSESIIQHLEKIKKLSH